MKKELFAAVSLALMLMVTAVSGRSAQAAAAELGECIDRISMADNTAAAAAEMNRAMEIWESRSRLLACFMDHRILDGITESLYSLSSALASGRPEQIQIEAQKLRQQLISMAEGEKLSLKGIL